MGPRYCPSIETKVVRFADKDRHQIFLEPEGRKTEEIYVGDFSTSMPEEVQLQMLHSVAGLEKAEMMRPGYAIEYDVIDPWQLTHTLETKKVKHLFTAGQMNGTSGYEEAAGQGLIAGINAALSAQGKPGFVLGRDEAYIGVLIDDLVTKGTNEPYRLLTSRAEYRLLLRHDNADLRLTEKGYQLGLISEDRYQRFLEKKAEIKADLAELKDVTVHPTIAVNEFLAGIGYIKKQEIQVDRLRRQEAKKIPVDIDYDQIDGLATEAREKFKQIRPETMAQAERISGVNPADLAILSVYVQNGKYSKVKD